MLLVRSTVAMGWSHVHQHGCEVGVTVSSEPPKGIHSISDLSYGSCFSLWLVWPNSCSVLASHYQLLLSSLTDLEGLHSIFSSKGEIFYIQSMVLEKHHCWQRVSRRTSSLKKKKKKLDSFLLWFFQLFPLQISDRAVSLCTSKAGCIWRKASHHFLNLLIVSPSILPKY